jgi:predicted SnoaL-like aldol condensation-catalyzing enzyme
MTENNEDMAVTFLKTASTGNVRAAYSRFISADFKHHNPFFEGSANALATGMEENARQNPDKVLEVKRVISEGDYVVIHSHVRQKSNDLGAAVVHIFRFANGLIAELWDVGQPIPNESPNQYGMF